jgi:hypothetical protein
MPVCVIVATAILNCTSAQALPPADAVRVLTSNTRPFVAPVRITPQYAPPIPHDPNWPFLSPMSPTRPLAPPWSVTTYYGRNHVETFFNGEPFPGVVYGGAATVRSPGRTVRSADREPGRRDNHRAGR